MGILYPLGFEEQKNPALKDGIRHKIQNLRSLKQKTDGASRSSAQIENIKRQSLKYRQEETAPTFLTMDEIKSIAEADFPLARLDVVRDMFLFSCFTGLAFIDAKELRYTDLFKDNNGKLWIRKSRHKIKKDKARCISSIPVQSTFRLASCLTFVTCLLKVYGPNSNDVAKVIVI